MPESNEKLEELLLKLCIDIEEVGLTTEELQWLVCNFLYTIGNSIEKDPSLQSSEMVLQRYAERPTFGNALMAQALWMKETWKVTDERKPDGKREHGSRERDDNETGPTAVQDLQGDQG